MTFSNAFTCKKSFVFLIKFQGRLFLIVHWQRVIIASGDGLSPKQLTSHTRTNVVQYLWCNVAWLDHKELPHGAQSKWYDCFYQWLYRNVWSRLSAFPGHQQPWYWLRNKYDFVFYRFQPLVPSQFRQMIENANVFLYFLKNIPYDKGS